MPTIEYMIARTLLRPRDLIQFFNTCIAQSDGKTLVDTNAVMAAEGVYSRERFRALVDEWLGIYPNLALSAQVLKKRKSNFKVEDLSISDIQENCLQSVTSAEAIDGDDLKEMNMVMEEQLKPEEYRKNLILILYKVGLIGLRTSDAMPISWTHLGSPSVSGAEIEDDSRVYVQQTFWRHFGIVA